MNRKFGMKSLSAASVSACLMFGISSGAQAATFTEPPQEAGSTLGTALAVPDGTTQINGRFDGRLNGGNDLVDLYRFTWGGGLFTAETFFATPNPPANGNLNNPQLFLFNDLGGLISQNDDISPNNLQSLISIVLGAGTYYLGITPFNLDPTFTSNVLSGWSGNVINDIGDNNSNYRINLSQPIPTPALLPGLIGMGLAALRKRKGEATEATSEQ